MTDLRRTVLGLALLLAPSAAWAHAHLATASPAENTVVQAPAEVALGFTQALEKRFSDIEVQDSHGTRVGPAPPRAEADPAHIAIALPKLPAGIYKVLWHATSVDTHRTEGSFTFTVAP